MKSIQVLKNVIKGNLVILILLFFTFIFLSAPCFCQIREDTLYVWYDKENPDILKVNESEVIYFAYFLFPPQYYFIGFKPKNKGISISKSCFNSEHKMVNLNGIKKIIKKNPDEILMCPNIYIVEDIGNDSLLVIPVKVFEAKE